MVQEAYLRWAASSVEAVSAKSYLCTIVTRLCVDHLRSAQVRREAYVGPWLPEPLIVDDAHDPGEMVVLNESLSTAFLVLLESLSPTERAVFLLRQVFDYDYADIAQIVEKSEANCRQMVRRARQRLTEGRPRYHADPVQVDALTRRFLAAWGSGDMDGLLALLADDATIWSDGGGRVTAARHPIQGAVNAARFLVGLAAKGSADVTVRFSNVGGNTGIILYLGSTPVGVITLAVADERVTGVYVTLNPDKLQHVPALH